MVARLAVVMVIMQEQLAVIRRQYNQVAVVGVFEEQDAVLSDEVQVLLEV